MAYPEQGHESVTWPKGGTEGMFKAVADAVSLFELNPTFPRMQVEMRDRVEALQETAGPEAQALGSPARLERVIKGFKIRAEGWLALVSDIPTQRAFHTIVHFLAWEAWTDYTGAPPENMRPTSERAHEAFDAIYSQIPIWQKAGYERLARMVELQNTVETHSGAEGLAQVIQSDVTSPRRAAVAEYIQEVKLKTGRTLRINDFWKAAGYSNATEYERWTRNDLRYNAKADRAFKEVLANKPHLKKQ